MTDFSTNPDKLSMIPKQPPMEKPPETEPVETKPVETKPAETRPPEPSKPKNNISASVLPYFLDEDDSGKFYFGYTEALEDGGRVIFRADAARMDHIVKEYVETLYALGYELVDTGGKDYNSWYSREWMPACDDLPDSGKD